jgi:outer membrane protein OmpA-like peptidoglycan-associated protein
MFKLITLGILILITNLVQAQNVQWASRVIEFSSELTPIPYSANQALHKPNVLPVGGESPNAWTPGKPDREEFIKVGFQQPSKIQQIAIAESYNPSTVFKIFTYDKEGNEFLINEFNPRAISITGRLLNVFFEMTPYEVHAVKIVLNGKAVPGYSSIDAIGISDSKIPIEVTVNVAENLRDDIVPERLSDKINSQYSELRPLISPDGNTLYFSRRNHPDNIGGAKDLEDIWYSERDPETGEWKEAKNMGLNLNNKGPNFISSITPDGNSVLLLLGNEYMNKGKMRAGVSISRKTEEGWSQPESLDIKNNYNIANQGNFFMSDSRKVLLMSVQRDDSYGERDLYVSFQEDNNKWSEPMNLGAQLNTAHSEIAPFLASDETTLYYSTKGFSGYGGNDIYVTRRLDETWKNWSEPENLGPNINTANDDQYFNIPASGEHAYYSRTESENNLDIYRIQMPVFYKPAPVVLVRGKVYDSKTKKPIEARILYEKLPEGMEIGEATSTSGTGDYQIILPSGAKYGYLAAAEGYLSINANIDLNNLTEYKEIEQDLYLVPVEAGEIVALRNIFFDFDKSNLKDDSSPELNRVVKFLQETPNIVIEIGGHTDSRGSDTYNMRLSENRAKAVHDYLVRNGISDNRVSYKAFGKTKPIATNDTDEGRQENRRVEFLVVKK